MIPSWQLYVKSLELSMLFCRLTIITFSFSMHWYCNICNFPCYLSLRVKMVNSVILCVFSATHEIPISTIGFGAKGQGTPWNAYETQHHFCLMWLFSTDLWMFSIVLWLFKTERTLNKMEFQLKVEKMENVYKMEIWHEEFLASECQFHIMCYKSSDWKF